jgi:hypothetical protein
MQFFGVGESVEICSGLDIIKVAAEDFLELDTSAKLSILGLVPLTKPGAQPGGFEARRRTGGTDGAC